VPLVRQLKRPVHPRLGSSPCPGTAASSTSAGGRATVPAPAGATPPATR
jgi:hypothetical protein